MATCPHCDGSGFVLSDDPEGVVRGRPCGCLQSVVHQDRQRRSRIPPRYAHCTFDEYESQHPSQADACKRAEAWAAGWPGVEHGLLFHGPAGTGKTHLAVAVARALVESADVRVLFYEQRELLKALQGTFDGRGDTTETEVLEPLREAQLLILDDVGAGRTTPWAHEVLHDLIVHRYNARLPLIITTNHSLEAATRSRGALSTRPLSLTERLGDPLMSRLYEMCVIIELDGKDFRRGVRSAQIQDALHKAPEDHA